MDFVYLINWFDFWGLFLMLAGFVIGLGSVSVVDILGFLGRKSSYWTEATIRTHKVTKPLIWVGIFLVVIGGLIFYRDAGLEGIPLIHFFIVIVLFLNGCFLSFKVSPFLLEREKEGMQGEVLPISWQRKIAVSLVVSDIGWWVGLALLVLYILAN